MKNALILGIIFSFINNVCALKPDSTYLIKPGAFGLMYKEYKVKTSDGYTLNMWFCPAQSKLPTDSLKLYHQKRTMIRPYVIDNVKKPTLIICDGDAGNMFPNASLAYFYCINGFNVITFDWRGFGESQYFPINTNYLVYPEFITDYNAIIDFTKQIGTVDSNKIGVFGYSTGAFLSFAMASQRSEIKALVARGIFTDYKSLIPVLKRIDPKKTLICPDGMDRYSPRTNWSTFRKPIFLIVGDLDKRTPKENSIEILSNIKSSVREIWVVDNAGHGGYEAPEVLESDLFFMKTIRFLKENL
jgi:pimeloyl-ACP methyl ester carboxylesterase